MRAPNMKSSVLAAVLAGVALGALVAVTVLERAQTKRVALGQFADPAYIHWLENLESKTGASYRFSNDVTPTSSVELPLGYYRPEVRCHQAPCTNYGEAPPREPETYQE
jgi:hypothetical protein